MGIWLRTRIAHAVVDLDPLVWVGKSLPSRRDRIDLGDWARVNQIKNNKAAGVDLVKKEPSPDKAQGEPEKIGWN